MTNFNDFLMKLHMFKNWKNICSRDVVFFVETNIGTRFDEKKPRLFNLGLSFPNQNILLKINALRMTALLERRNFSKKNIFFAKFN